MRFFFVCLAFGVGFSTGRVFFVAPCSTVSYFPCGSLLYISCVLLGTLVLFCSIQCFLSIKKRKNPYFIFRVYLVNMSHSLLQDNHTKRLPMSVGMEVLA